MRKTATLFVFFAVLAPCIGATNAAAGGNSANAKTCQSNGWQNFTQANGTPFVNQGDCVSYGAQGGILTPKSPGLSF